MTTLHLAPPHQAIPDLLQRYYKALLHAAAASNPSIRVIVPGPTTGFQEAVKIIREEQPDLIEIADRRAFCLLAAAVRRGWLQGIRRPVLVGLTCARMEGNAADGSPTNALGRWMSGAYLRYIYGLQFDALLDNAPYPSTVLRDSANFRARPVHVVPMGPELGAFSPSRRTPGARYALLQFVHASQESRILVYAGRITAERNVILLPHVLERLPSTYRLIIAGDGPFGDVLSAECARRTHNRVRFVFNAGRELRADLLANADVFVYPNPRVSSDVEPLEAMASGLPVVAPATCGARAYPSDETAWLANPDPDHFAEAVDQVFADPITRTNKLDRAACYASTFRWEHITQRVFEIYERLICESVSRAAVTWQPAQPQIRQNP